jgi:hypothetical protein
MARVTNLGIVNFQILPYVVFIACVNLPLVYAYVSPCHAKSVVWTNRVFFPGIYNVSSFTVISLFGQFRWSSCSTLALFSDLSDNHLLGALLEGRR